MNDKEKNNAERLSELAGGSIPAGNEPPEVLDAADALFAIRGATGDSPELNPAFSDTLRARLVREVEKKSAATVEKTAEKSAPVRTRSSGMSRRKWIQYAVAACFFIFFLPTVFLMRDIQVRYKMAMVAKYDKMYVPYSKQLDKRHYLEKKLEPFGGERQVGSVTTDTFEVRESRADDFFSKYRNKRGR